MSSIKLFCFPYAGGSAQVFKPWRRYLHEQIELIPVELAGRGIRMGETLYRDTDDAVTDIIRTIQPMIAQGPYALFGHSMGCKIVYELLHRINAKGLPAPQQAFFSGRSAPHLTETATQQLHLLDDNDFLQTIRDFGGTPPEFFDHPDLLHLFLPVLRNDFRLSETGNTTEDILPFAQDIAVLAGRGDPHMYGDIEEWKKYTHAQCHIYEFDGGHFFLQHKIPEITALINMSLTEGYWPHPAIFD